MNFKMIAVAAALVAAGTANAAIDSFNGNGVLGNGSLTLVMLDATGSAQRGLIVDLGFNFSDFATVGAGNNVAGTTISWDLANNTITKNGALVSGASTNGWSAQLADFLSKSDAAETRWAVISGSQKTLTSGTGAAFLTTGNPDASQLTQQNATATTKWTGVTKMIEAAAGSGTLASATNGAYSMGATDAGWVADGYASTDIEGINGWLNQAKWNTWNGNGDTTGFWKANTLGAETQLGDVGSFAQLTFSGNTLTYAVAAVPEPESFVLAVAGLAALVVARRRAAK